MRVVVVLPTFNEAENITDVLYRVRAAAPDVGILVVDDNSADGTADLAEVTARAIGGDIQVLRREGKAGLGSAYRAGFTLGMDQGADVLVEMDSDLSHDPADLPALLAAVEHGADLAIGSRYVPGGRIPAWSWHRKMLSRWGNRYALALWPAVNDATAGYAYGHRGQTIDLHGSGPRATALRSDDLPPVRPGGRVVEVPSRSSTGSGASPKWERIVVEALGLVTWCGCGPDVRRAPA